MPSFYILVSSLIYQFSLLSSVWPWILNCLPGLYYLLNSCHVLPIPPNLGLSYAFHPLHPPGKTPIHFGHPLECCARVGSSVILPHLPLSVSLPPIQWLALLFYVLHKPLLLYVCIMLCIFICVSSILESMSHSVICLVPHTVRSR